MKKFSDGHPYCEINKKYCTECAKELSDKYFDGLRKLEWPIRVCLNKKCLRFGLLTIGFQEKKGK